MATFSEFTNPGVPSDGNPSHFPPFGNVGAPYMATLSLPRLTIGLPVWLFSTSLVPAVSTSGQSVPPPEQHHVDSKVDLSPSSPVSTSSSPTSPGESLDSSNQVAKKKKKKTKKKKSLSERLKVQLKSSHLLLLRGRSNFLVDYARMTIFCMIFLVFPGS